MQKVNIESAKENKMKRSLSLSENSSAADLSSTRAQAPPIFKTKNNALPEVRPPQPHEHFEHRFNFNLRTHCSKVDASFVDYLLDSERGNFIVYFDEALYEPPQIILNLEQELEK